MSLPWLTSRPILAGYKAARAVVTYADYERLYKETKKAHYNQEIRRKYGHMVNRNAKVSRKSWF